MINRLQGLFVEARPPPPPEVYLVCILQDWFYVTADEAARVMDHAAGWGEQWVRFTDLFGSAVHARREYISIVRECRDAEKAAVLAELERDRQEASGSGESEESSGSTEGVEEEEGGSGSGG